MVNRPSIYVISAAKVIDIQIGIGYLLDGTGMLMAGVLSWWYYTGWPAANQISEQPLQRRVQRRDSASSQSSTVESESSVAELLNQHVVKRLTFVTVVTVLSP